MGDGEHDNGYVARLERAAPALVHVARIVARQEVAHAMSLGPPRPIPTWLMPLRGALGGDDQCLSVSIFELDALIKALELELGETGHVPLQLRIVQRDGSPWLELDAVVNVIEPLAVPHDLDEARRLARELERAQTVSLALWRYTCAVYRVGSDGAVEDDPMYTPDDRSYPT